MSEDKIPDSNPKNTPDEPKSTKTIAADSRVPAATASPRPTRQSVNPYAFALCVAAIVILTKGVSFLTPYKLYFTFSSFLYGENKIFKWESLTIKLAIPCIVGFCLYLLPFHWMRITSGSRISYRSIFRYLSRQSELSAKMCGFFAALLMAWPFIVYWDIMMRPDKLHLKAPFLLVYMLYFISYTYFAGLGVVLAKLLLQTSLPRGETVGMSGRVSWLESIRTSALGIVTSAAATHFASQLAAAP